MSKIIMGTNPKGIDSSLVLPSVHYDGYLEPYNFLKCSLRAITLPLVLSLTACTTMDEYGKNTTATSSIVSTPTVAEIEPSRTSTELRFAVAGDIMVHESQLHSAYNKSQDAYDFSPVFNPVREMFAHADVAIANLETTLPGKDYSGYPAFGAPDSLVDAIKSAGIGILTTANNHCLDKGKAALIRTVRVLDEKGISHLGTYASEEAYAKQRIFFLEKNDISVAMMNYTYGTNEIPTPKGTVVNRIDKKQIQDDIAMAHAKKADAVIVFFHFGEEYLNKPDHFQQEMVAHALASGADIVLGGHPHHIQPYEAFHERDEAGADKPKLVAYSLGNFVSAQRQRYTDGGMVLYFTLAKRLDASGKSTVSINDVHHKLVWVHLAHHEDRRYFHILPIESYLTSPGDIELTPGAIKEMKRFRSDADEILGIKETAIQARLK